MGFTSNRKPLSVKFARKGDSVTGIVQSVEDVPRVAFDESGQINGLFYDAQGEVVEQTEITLKLIRPDGELSDELVVLRTGGSIFTKAGKEVLRVGSGMYYAIAEAIDAADPSGDSDDLAEGDQLTVTYTGDGEATSEDRNAPKLYTATVVKG